MTFDAELGKIERTNDNDFTNNGFALFSPNVHGVWSRDGIKLTLELCDIEGNPSKRCSPIWVASVNSDGTAIQDCAIGSLTALSGSVSSVSNALVLGLTDTSGTIEFSWAGLAQHFAVILSNDKLVVSPEVGI
ncbi:MAG: hypothetical protein AB8B85_16830 [Paracoccaceae bacterium]